MLATGRMATRLVLSDRISTWFIERLTVSEYVIRPDAERPRVFSSIRSKTTIVSYSEYPRIVKKATTVAGVTSNRVSEYTPTVMRMSWITAMIAATAIFHSNRNEMYTVMRMKKTISAVRALLVTALPHEGPTSLMLTCCGFVCVALAMASVTLVCSS